MVAVDQALVSGLFGVVSSVINLDNNCHCLPSVLVVGLFGRSAIISEYIGWQANQKCITLIKDAGDFEAA
jgi:hypothetical protein